MNKIPATNVSKVALANGAKVKLYQTGDDLLDGQTGTVVGKHGAYFPIVLFDNPPVGYDPAICILCSCVELDTQQGEAAK